MMDATNIQSDHHCKCIGPECPLSMILAALWHRSLGDATTG